MRIIIGIVLLTLPYYIHALSKDVIPDSCLSPQACILKISEVLDRDRSPGQYPSKREQAIIKKLITFGDDALPAILKLLENDSELVARIGAITLQEFESIDEKYLPLIIKGLERDVSWLAPALAKIGTPKAAEVAVKKYLVSDGAPHNQEAFAVESFGIKAITSIIRAAKCEFQCSDDTYYLLGSVIGDMKNDRSKVAKSLLKIAEDSSQPTEVRNGILYMISFLDTPAKVIEDQLLTLRQKEQSLLNATNYALIGIKSKHAGKIYADILSQGADRYILRDIAELGPSGNDAGASIIDLLESSDMEIRVFAARTLGFIEYNQAAPKLIQLLNDPSDVQLNWVAAQSLGRMKSKTALPELRSTSENHWYPPVKNEAQRAIKHIESGENYKSEFHRNNFAFDYFDFQRMDMDACENITLEHMPEDKDTKLYRSYAREQLSKLAYASVILSYGADNEEQQKAEDPNGIIEVNASNMVEHRQDIKQVPQVALKVSNGWLAGSNRGEWGGELVFIPDNGEAIKILDENIEDIYKLGNRYIATTGLAHLSMNHGMIYELTLDNEGYWHKKEWLKLPGSPYSSWFVKTGELLVNTSGGGSLLISENGAMRMASCK